MATCHPGLKHKARGLCVSCYLRSRHAPTGRPSNPTVYRDEEKWRAAMATPERREAARRLGLSRRTHGHSGNGKNQPQSPTYQSWRAMKARCLQPRSRDFPRYGGRGIHVDPRWLGPEGFGNFLADLGERPGGMTLDRIDNDGGYEPGNTRWASPIEQRRNRPTPSGWKCRPRAQPTVYGTKTVPCPRCGTELVVSALVHAKYCPPCRRAVNRECTARYRAKQHV
jgi:hypothetical protein